MRIGLNILFRAQGTTGGVETYVRRLIDQIVNLDKRNEYLLFVSGAPDLVTESANVTVIRCDFDSRRRAVRYWWEQTALPIKVRRHNIQLLHSMNYVSPVICPCKSLVTFQDVSYREPSVS